MKSATTLTVGRKKLSFSNLDKVLYPKTGFTKGDLISFYAEVGPTLLPHLAKRAITLKRYPSGVEQPFFYEKRCPSHKPDFVKTAAILSRREGTINYCVMDNLPSLLWIANLGSIEIHASLSRAAKPDRPQWMVFDLDPGPPATILDCARVALRVRDVLAGIGLQCLVKTSGGKGLHLLIPLNTPVTYEQTKPFSHTVGQLLERDDPKRITSTMTKTLREGKVFIDWSQNDLHKTTAIVYSMRARETPSVSTPISWDELQSALKKKDPAKLVFSPADVLKRIAKLGDLFGPALTLKQKLPGLPV